MSTYRLEVLATYPADRGIPDDIAAEAVMAVQGHDLVVVSVYARRARGTDLVSVIVAFDAPDDGAALRLLCALPGEVRRSTSVQAGSLRTGHGRSMRRLGRAR